MREINHDETKIVLRFRSQTKRVATTARSDIFGIGAQRDSSIVRFQQAFGPGGRLIDKIGISVGWVIELKTKSA